MADAQELSLAFIEAHPRDAARVLEQLPAGDAAAFLESAPIRLATPVVRSLLYPKAAECMLLLGDDTAAGLLNAIGTQAGAAVLRSLPQSRRSALLDQLPSVSALAFRMLLGYPEDAVGAWMDATVPVFMAETPATEALAQLRTGEYPSKLACCVYALDADQRLAGIIMLHDLIRAEPETLLSSIMRPYTHAVPARLSLLSARTHPGWEEMPSLPVVERENHFAGALHQSVLTTALARTGPATAPNTPGDGAVAANLANAFWTVFAGLLQTAVSLLPARPGKSQEDRTHEG